MLNTNAYVFLNIDDPVCAWCACRGVLVPASIHGHDQGFISSWSAGVMRAADPARLSRELILEAIRSKRFPQRVSRLSGMYCFLDIDSARRAASVWGTGRRGTHFRSENLAEIYLEGGTRRDRLDSNWITYADRGTGGFLKLDDLQWIENYWSGEPYPEKSPIWETVFDGRMNILGTDLRTQAYERIKSEFPDSLGVLEIARQAAWIGSELGDACAWLTEDENSYQAHYLLNWKDAANPLFIAKLSELHRSGHPTYCEDLGPHLRNGNFGKVPDLRPYAFTRPKQVVSGSIAQVDVVRTAHTHRALLKVHSHHV
jgi:hypothetical protein